MPSMARILIVDDEESILRILSTLFKARGFDISTASDGGDAMDILAKEEFDVLLTDVRMRPMDGLALLKFATANHPEMQVIMLTAYASVESAIEALKFGAFDYITKPFDVGELTSTVDRALAFRGGVTHSTEEKEREDDHPLETHRHRPNKKLANLRRRPFPHSQRRHPPHRRPLPSNAEVGARRQKPPGPTELEINRDSCQRNCFRG